MDQHEVRSFGQGATITFLGGLAGSALTYLTGIVVARLVGAELLGIYFLSLVWLNLGSSLARFGLADALVRFVPPARLRQDYATSDRVIKTSLVAGLGLGLGFAVFLFAGIASPGLRPIDGELGSYLAWLIWILPLHVLFILLLMVAQAHQKMARVVLARDILQPVVLLLATVILLKTFGPRVGLIGGLALSYVVALPLAFGTVRSLAPGAFAVSGWAPLRPLVLFAFPVALGDLSNYLYRWIDTLLIESFLSLKDVGLYNAASRTAMLVSLVLFGANAIYASTASGYFNTDQPVKLERALELSVRWCLLLALPIVIVCFLGGEWILLLWGREFASGAPILAMLAGAHLLGIPSGLLAYTLVMGNRQLMEVGNTIVILGVIVVANVVLIPRMGIAGAAQSLLLANLLGLLVRSYQVWRVVGIRPFAPSLLKPLAAGGVALVGAYWAKDSLLTWTGTDALPEDAVVLLGLLASLGVMIVTMFLGPYLLLDVQGRQLVRSTLLKAQPHRYAP